MISIIRHEFLKNIKSIKSVIIVLIFVIVSYSMSRYFKSSSIFMKNDDMNTFYSIIRLLVLFLGYIFATTLAHDSINKEVSLQTARLIITKTSKVSFFLGKFFSMVLFWIFCLSTSFLIISVIARTFDIYVYFMIIITMIYFLSIIFFLSTIISKQSLSNFVGILLGFIIPVIGAWVTLDNTNVFNNLLKYLFPYYYILNGGLYIIVPLIISIFIVLITLKIFVRKDI